MNSKIPKKILVIVDARIPVPPLLYGGTERIANLLCNGLQNKDYIVNLIAKKGSANYGGKTICHKPANNNIVSRIYRKILFQIIIIKLLLFNNYKAIINFGRVDYLWYILNFTKIPLINVFQNPIANYEIEILAKRKERIRIIGISQNQVKNIKFPNINVIYNAVDIHQFKLQISTHKNHLLFIGRLTYNKGIDTAIKLAKRVQLPLIIAGNISNEPGAAVFYEKEVLPHLNDSIQYVGEVNDEQKMHYLSEAIATLFPIRWEEPFGIVMIESLACGVPVIASNVGSVPEVIKHGITGFIYNNEVEMVAAVTNIHQIIAENCRKEVEVNFSQDVLADQYIKIIESYYET
jgi:glycosyltransferase involved in cell wall biosynthesis